MVSNIKLVLSIKLRPLVHVESHGGDVVLRDVHLVGSLFVLGRELLAHVSGVVAHLAVRGLVLCKRTARKVGLVHLHWVHLLSIWPEHVHSGATTAIIWGGTSVRHTADVSLALKSHTHGHICTHLVHLLEVDSIHGLEGIHLLVDHVIDANL